MKKNIKLAMALGLIGAASVHAANISLTTSSPITNEVVVGAGDSWEQSGDFTISSTGFLNQTTNSSGRFRIGVSNTGTLTIDGGALNVETSNTLLLGNGHAARIGTIDLLSGSLNLDPGGSFFIGRDRATGIVRIQGGTATFGSLPTFDAPNGTGPDGVGFVDFTTANSGTLTIAGADLAYYQGLYAGDDLYFNGDNTAAFGSVFSVSGETITAIPEPATLGLVVAFGGGLLFFRRRFMK